MKATISQEGFLSVSPETELEAYALGQWSNQNFNDLGQVINLDAGCNLVVVSGMPTQVNIADLGAALMPAKN